MNQHSDSQRNHSQKNDSPNNSTPETKDKIHVLKHALASHYLGKLRNKNTGPEEFRTACRKISQLLAMEVSKNLEVSTLNIETPMEETVVHEVSERIVIIPILRAGLGMVEAMVDLFPKVNIGYVGIQRDETTAQPHYYYSKFPHLNHQTVVITDPMLATGGSAVSAIELIKKQSPRKIIYVSIVSAPEGVEFILKNHPDVLLYTAALDRELNDLKYILPGLGDFGDRLYGTFEVS